MFPNSHYAFGRNDVEIESVMRFGSVKRWHMVDTTKTQSLAEHSANVALLVKVIASAAPGLYFGDPMNAAGNALIHDLPEVFLGDIPTHTKPLIDVGKLAMAEEVVLPASLQPKVSPQVRLLIKICDLADAIRFIRLHGVGATAKHASEGIEQHLADKFLKAGKFWPEPVYQKVVDSVWLYAFETRDKAASRIVGSVAGPMAPNVA